MLKRRLSTPVPTAPPTAELTATGLRRHYHTALSRRYAAYQADNECPVISVSTAPCTPAAAAPELSDAQDVANLYRGRCYPSRGCLIGPPPLRQRPPCRCACSHPRRRPVSWPRLGPPPLRPRPRHRPSRSCLSRGCRRRTARGHDLDCPRGWPSCSSRCSRELGTSAKLHLCPLPQTPCACAPPRGPTAGSHHSVYRPTAAAATPFRPPTTAHAARGCALGLTPRPFWRHFRHNASPRYLI